MALKDILGSVGGRLVENQQSSAGDVSDLAWKKNKDSFFSPRFRC